MASKAKLEQLAFDGIIIFRKCTISKNIRKMAAQWIIGKPFFICK